MSRLSHLFGCAARNWSAHDGSASGAALAFFCAFSLAPLLVILLALAGTIVGEEIAFAQQIAT